MTVSRRHPFPRTSIQLHLMITFIPLFPPCIRSLDRQEDNSQEGAHTFNMGLYLSTLKLPFSSQISTRVWHSFHIFILSTFTQHSSASLIIHNKTMALNHNAVAGPNTEVQEKIRDTNEIENYLWGLNAKLQVKILDTNVTEINCTLVPMHVEKNRFHNTCKLKRSTLESNLQTYQFPVQWKPNRMSNHLRTKKNWSKLVITNTSSLIFSGWAMYRKIVLNLLILNVVMCIKMYIKTLYMQFELHLHGNNWKWFFIKEIIM